MLLPLAPPRATITGISASPSLMPAPQRAWQAIRLPSSSTEDEPSDPDFASALKWARQAAEAGSATGQSVLAYVLTYGPEAMRDLEKAHQWYQRSAAAGCPEGCLGYALSLAPRTQDDEGRREIAEHLRRAAETELPTPIYLLAVLTEHRGSARPGGRRPALPSRGRAWAAYGTTALGSGADRRARRRAGPRRRRIVAAPRGTGR
jgi:TPR repeat protein